MLRKLFIHHFRGIREGLLEDFNQINLIIGPNNSGKTAVLEMLYLAGIHGRHCTFLSENLAGISDSETVVPTILRGAVPLSADFLGYTPWSRLWQRHGQAQKWKASNGSLTESNALIYRIRNLPNTHPLRIFRLIPPDAEDVDSDYGGFDKNDILVTASFRLLADETFPPVLTPASFIPTAIGSDTRLTYSWYPNFIYQNSSPNDSFPLAVGATQGQIPHSGQILFFDFHTVHQHFTASFRNAAWNNVPDWYEKIAKSLGHVFPELDGRQVEINTVAGTSGNFYTGYIRQTRHTPLLIDVYGDGTRHAFKVLTALITLLEKSTPERPSLFLWEDPELFMHPSALQRLTTEIIRLVLGQPIQLFISTHSLELIAIIGQMMQENNELGRNIHTYTLQLSQSGELHYRLLQEEGIHYWLESGFDPRDGFSNLAESSPLSWKLISPESEEQVPW